MTDEGEILHTDRLLPVSEELLPCSPAKHRPSKWSDWIPVASAWYSPHGYWLRVKEEHLGHLGPGHGIVENDLLLMEADAATWPHGQLGKKPPCVAAITVDGRQALYLMTLQEYTVVDGVQQFRVVMPEVRKDRRNIIIDVEARWRAREKAANRTTTVAPVAVAVRLNRTWN